MPDTDNQPTTPDPQPGPPLDPSTSQMTATIPYQGNPESVDVNTPDQTPQLDPSTSQMTATIPSETPPNSPDVERQFHERGWHRALQIAANIMSPGDVSKVSFDPKTGEATITRGAATTGEKWGRVAAAALTGAAAGLANSQGPGGMARATAAGVQAGMQQRPQQEQQVQQEADFQNKQLLSKANRIAIQQKTIGQIITNKELGIKAGKEEADQANALNEELQNSPWHDDLGLFPDMASAMKAAQTDPAIIKDHAQAKHRVLPEYNGDGSLKGFHVYNEDPSVGERKNEKPLIPHKMTLTQDADGLMKPTLPEDPDNTIPINGAKMSDFHNSEDAETAKYMSALKTYADAKKNLGADENKGPKTYQEAYAKALDPNLSEQDRAKWNAFGDKLFKDAQQLKATSSTTVNMGSKDAVGQRWAPLLSNPSSGVTLAQVPKEQRSAAVDYMNANGIPISHPLTSKELDRSDLAHNAIDNVNAAMAILKRRPDMFGPGGFLKSQFRKALAGGDPDAQDFLTNITLANLPAVGVHGVRGKWALEDLGKYDSNLYLNAQSMERALNDIIRSSGDFAHMGGRQIEGGGAAPSTKPRAPLADRLSNALGGG